MTSALPRTGEADLALKAEADRARLGAGARPFPAYAHAQMLADERRLAAFKQAIDAFVEPNSTVVDIGTGTGILASYAAARTSGTVYGLELEATSAALAAMLCEENGLENVRIVNAASFARPIDCSPDVVVSETLGPLGIDEHIVEILWEFCLRYPTVRTLIPHAVTLSCLPVRSAALRAHVDDLVAMYTRASWARYTYSSVLREIEQALGCFLLQESFADAAAVASAATLAHYDLGRSRSSRFERSVQVPAEADGVYLYFSASLGGGRIISTDLTEPEGHWGRYWVFRPGDARTLRIAFEPGPAKFRFAWQ